MPSDPSSPEGTLDSFMTVARTIVPRLSAAFVEIVAETERSGNGSEMLHIGAQLPDGAPVPLGDLKKLQELSATFSASAAYRVVVTVGALPKGNDFLPGKVMKAEDEGDLWQQLLRRAQRMIASRNSEEAEKAALKTLAIAETFPTDDSRQALTLELLASIYFGSEKYQYGEPVLSRLLQMYIRSIGHRHLDTATIEHNLALLYHCSGEYEKARKLYEVALGTKIKLLGEDNPQVAYLKSHIDRLPRREEAEELPEKESESEIDTGGRRRRELRKQGLTRTNQFDAIAAEEFLLSKEGE
ncbi:MAG: tetratricopeptide repeat protein [Candidatus Obscuribacterales bacterium]